MVYVACSCIVTLRLRISGDMSKHMAKYHDASGTDQDAGPTTAQTNDRNDEPPFLPSGSQLPSGGMLRNLLSVPDVTSNSTRPNSEPPAYQKVQSNEVKTQKSQQENAARAG